jgi:uncharacterized integral membrane protein
MDTFSPAHLIIVILYFVVVGSFVWLVLRFVRAVEHMGRALEDIASSLKKDRM